jgi:hypothetical protein
LIELLIVPERIKKWGGKTEPYTKTMMHRIMESKKRPEQGFRGCLGIKLNVRFDERELESGHLATALVL